jgi:hypothetical protein
MLNIELKHAVACYITLRLHIRRNLDRPFSVTVQSSRSSYERNLQHGKTDRLSLTAASTTQRAHTPVCVVCDPAGHYRPPTHSISCRWLALLGCWDRLTERLLAAVARSQPEIRLDHRFLTRASLTDGRTDSVHRGIHSLQLAPL